MNNFFFDFLSIGKRLPLIAFRLKLKLEDYSKIQRKGQAWLINMIPRACQEKSMTTFPSVVKCIQ